MKFIPRLVIRAKRVLFWGAFTVFIVIPGSLYFVPPVRNNILRPVWPHSWRAISTSDILRMLAFKIPANVTDLLDCPNKVPPSLKLSEVPLHSKMITYPKATLDHDVFKEGGVYESFLPGLPYKNRQDMVWLYLVMAQALQKAKVRFFFSNGSLLGVFRHGGLIPWDTDMDLAFDVKDWKTVRQVLSCIEGFRLVTSHNWHWKFMFDDRAAPFIDIFFCTDDDKYVWSLTDYVFQTLVYKTEDVFPLTTMSFEGIQVPVPALTENVLRHEFNVIEYCYPQDKNYLTKKAHKVGYIYCSALADVYQLHNLRH